MKVLLVMNKWLVKVQVDFRSLQDWMATTY